VAAGRAVGAGGGGVGVVGGGGWGGGVLLGGGGGVYGMENRNAYGTKAQTCASYWFTMETIFWNGYLNLCNRGTLIVLRGLLVVKSNGWCDFPKQSLELSEDVLGQNTI